MTKWDSPDLASDQRGQHSDHDRHSLVPGSRAKVPDLFVRVSEPGGEEGATLEEEKHDARARVAVQ
jgi:hypothetical protein